MPTPESSLSVALQGFADFLADNFEEDVVVTVDAPQKAQEQAKDASTHILNIFVYRIAPSGFHASLGDEDPSFIRANILLTAFPAGQGAPPPDSDLRVLGQAIRVLQSFPVIPGTLPGPAPGGAPEDFRNNPVSQYQMQAVLQAPTVEELNHIWTTQGGELAYRLSAAYELALIPIEPLTHASPAPEVSAGEIVLGVGKGPLAFQMFQQTGRLFSHIDVTPGTASTNVNVTGTPETKAEITVEWTREDGSIERQSAQIFDIQTNDVNAPEATISVAIENATNGDQATLLTKLLDGDLNPVDGSAPANPIHLSVVT